jgi:hypothetical protein
LFARVSKWIVVAALTLSLGLHWMLLQSVAWAGMIANYSRSATIQEAVVKTFDGDHPCKLCKIVREGREKEKKQDIQKPTTKLDLLREDFCGFASVRLPYQIAFGHPTFFYQYGDSPPSPPPRLAVA